MFWVALGAIVVCIGMGVHFWRETREYRRTRRALEDYWFTPAPVDDQTSEMPVLAGRHAK